MCRNIRQHFKCSVDTFMLLNCCNLVHSGINNNLIENTFVTLFLFICERIWQCICNTWALKTVLKRRESATVSK